jgi:beta-mannosidase
MRRVDCNGRWELTGQKADRALPDRVEARLPGDNLTALHEQGLIPDPYVGCNELDIQWAGMADWIFERMIDCSRDFAAEPYHWFRAESLDTIAEVWINGRVVARSDNMFVPTQVLLPPSSIKPGANSLRVVFHSPVRTAAERAESLPYPVPFSDAPVFAPHRNLLRKAQCHSGWDWGPCLMVSGSYGFLELAGSDSPLLTYAPAVPACEGGEWKIIVKPIFASWTQGAITGDARVRVRAPSGKLIAESGRKISVDAGAQPETIEISIADPELWWPNGMGDQPLYSVSTSVFGCEVSVKVGFRHLQLRREPDEFGESFEFVINDVPVFAKGANWIPIDALPGRASDTRARELVTSAAEANMNMLRVWGGGAYERDAFYDACDELGLLVWQDFMFACALYPSERWFLESVDSEVTHQVERLKHHPSIALWCGNNENVGALGWYPEAKADRDRYVVDYDRLYEGVIGERARALDSSRPFWPSSPSRGLRDYSDGWTSDDRGDVHCWSVWHGGKPISAYRSIVPRFCSEFGFQSFPSLSEIATYAPPDQYNVTSPVMEHHQKNRGGNAIIMGMLMSYFRFPVGLAQQVYVSQLLQAMAIETAVEYWRSQRPRSMGALYWQLNDTWPVASWSSLEYSGKWKLLHYVVRRCFEPVAVFIVPVSGNGAAISDDGEPAGWDCYVVNDTTLEVAGTLTIQLRTLDGAVNQEVFSDRVLARAVSSSRLLHIDADAIRGLREEQFVNLRWESGAGDVSSTRLLTTPKRYHFPRPNLATSIKRDNGGLALTIESDDPAFYVSLDSGSMLGRFSDNCFTVLPDSPVTVSWIGDPVPEDRFRSVLSVMNLGEIGT